MTSMYPIGPEASSASGPSNFRGSLRQLRQGKTQYVRNCGALMNSKLGMRGLLPVEAQGRTWFAQVSLEFMELTRALLVLRLLCRNTQDIEEVYIYIYIYIISQF